MCASCNVIWKSHVYISFADLYFKGNNVDQVMSVYNNINVSN